MQNTYNYISPLELNAKLQSLLEKGHIDEYLVEQIRDMQIVYQQHV